MPSTTAAAEFLQSRELVLVGTDLQAVGTDLQAVGLPVGFPWTVILSFIVFCLACAGALRSRWAC